MEQKILMLGLRVTLMPGRIFSCVYLFASCTVIIPFGKFVLRLISLVPRNVQLFLSPFVPAVRKSRLGFMTYSLIFTFARNDYALVLVKIVDG